MKILLSAYVCGAGRGSEPGVGWNVARALSLLGHSVTVVCSPLYEEENRRAIREEQLDIRLVTVPNNYKSNLFIKRHVRWQKAAADVIRQEVQNQQIDVVHHVTFNQYRGLRDVLSAGVPYLVGPIGGAETIPLPFLLHGGLSFMARVKELLRYVSGDAIGMIRRCNSCLSRGKVLASNSDTANRLKQGINHLNIPVEVYPAIAIDESEIEEKPPVRNLQEPYFLLYASLKRAEKGLHIVLQAMSRYRQAGGKCKLVIVGAPEEEHERISGMCRRLDLSESAVELNAFVPRSRMMQLMAQTSAVLYAAYRDSGSMTVLEAVAKGIPVICYDVPSQQWASQEWVMKVPVRSSIVSPSRVVDDLSEALQKAESPGEWDLESHQRRCEWLRREMTWGSRARRFVREYQELLK